jgi:spore germination protein GerM
MRRLPITLLPLLLLAAACDAPAPDSSEPGSSAPAAPRSDVRDYDTVFVYFQAPAGEGEIEGPQVAFPRGVPPDTDALAFALAELLKGPTAGEAAGPYHTWFSDQTAGMLGDVTLEGGVAVVDFDDFRSLIPGASTSAGSAMLLAQLEATVFQFPEVRRVEFRIDGSCDAFMGWLQYGCVPVPRSSFTAPAGYRRAVAK